MISGTWRRNVASSKHASSWARLRRAGDGRVGGEQVAQRAALVGRAQRRALDDRVGVLARQAAILDERDQHAGCWRAGPRPRSMFSRIRSGRTTRPSTSAGHPDEHVVEQDRGVGQDHPLGATSG